MLESFLQIILLSLHTSEPISLIKLAGQNLGACASTYIHCAHGNSLRVIDIYESVTTVMGATQPLSVNNLCMDQFYGSNNGFGK